MEDSLKLSQIQELVQENRLDSVLIKADEMFPDYEKIMVAEEYCRFLYNGNKFRSTHLIGDNHQKENDFVRVYDSNDRFTGIYQYSKEEYKPVKMFL
jgi:Pseudouridine synthase